MRKFGVVTATAAELENVLNALGGVDRLEESGGHEIYHVSRGKNKLYIVVSGAGEIAAAAATQLLITKYDVDAILNFGFVGALDATLKCQQVVIVKDVVHYDFDTSAIDNFTVGQYEGFDDSYLPTDKKLLAQACASFPELRPVRVASGDKFIADSEKKDWLIQTFHADICDMETAGIVLTAIRNAVPTLSIKVVSDNADENSPVSYMDVVYNMSRKCAGILAAFLDEVGTGKKPQRERQKQPKTQKNKKTKKKE